MSIQIEAANPRPKWTFGDRVRKVRTSRKMDQRSFAAALGVTAAALAAWECGRSIPRDKTVIAERLETIFGVARGWTLGVDEPVDEPTESPLAA